MSVNFLVMNALALKDLPEVFDAAIDCGLFHVFSDDDRRRYVAGLATRRETGRAAAAALFQRRRTGNHRATPGIAAGDCETAFAQGWAIESIEPARFEVRADIPI